MCAEHRSSVTGRRLVYGRFFFGPVVGALSCREPIFAFVGGTRDAGPALGLAAFGGLLASGAAGTATTLLWPYVQQLGPYQGVLVTAGVLGWTVAAWTLAPPPTKNDHESDPVGEEHQ
ncbi:hypothetical protein ACFCWQ_41750, partial [Streptomyces sp. NPDC056401]